MVGWTLAEARKFFKICRSLSVSGYSTISISHKLDEVMNLCEQITVLRNGWVAGNVASCDANHRLLGNLLVGRDVFLQMGKEPLHKGETVLEVENIGVLNDRKIPGAHKISFPISGGEILGVAGIDGNGQLELAEALMGLRPKKEGSVKSTVRR